MATDQDVKVEVPLGALKEVLSELADAWMRLDELATDGVAPIDLETDPDWAALVASLQVAPELLSD